MSSYALPIAGPLGGAEVSGTEITIDDLAGSPSIITETIATLVEANQGYIVGNFFNTPGFSVKGGAIIYTESFPQDLFLDADQSLAPRAPGARAPLIGAARRGPSIARAESLSGRFDIYDETRRDGDVLEVIRVMNLVANTFADRMQTRGLATLQAAITAWGRTTTLNSWSDAASASGGTINVARTTQPEATFAAVLKQFEDDKTGIRPDVVAMATSVAYNLRTIMGRDLQDFLESYGIKTMVSTPQLAAGNAIWGKAGGVGEVAFAKPLETEDGRGPTGTYKDEYSVEGQPVFVARNAYTVLRVTGLED